MLLVLHVCIIVDGGGGGGIEQGSAMMNVLFKIKTLESNWCSNMDTRPPYCVFSKDLCKLRHCNIEFSSGIQ